MTKKKKARRVVLGVGEIYLGALSEDREVSLENPARRWEGARELRFPKDLSGKLVRLIAEVLD